MLSKLAGAVCLLPACVLAADPPGLSEKDFIGEMPVILSVSRLPQPQNEVPGAVTIIDREMIRRSGAREVADLLRLVPGFQTTEARGGNALAVYHGTFFDLASRLQVLVDGRSVYSPHYVGSASSGMRNVPLEDVERIEVLRGSNSANYGARAFLGVVNIVTRDPADTTGGLISLSAGQRALFDGTARIGWGGDQASFRLTATERGDAGFSPMDANRLRGVNFRGDMRAGTRDTIEVRLGASEQTWHGGFADTALNTPHLRGEYGGYAQVDWRRSLSADSEFRMAFSHTEQRYDDRYFTKPTAVPSFLIDFGGLTKVDALEFNHRFSASPRTRVSWGGELRNEQIRSLPLYASSDARSTRFARIYANLEWRATSSVLVNAGAMFEKSSDSGDVVLPRVMLNWLVSPRHTLRAGVARSHRPASVFETQANQRFFIPGSGTLQNWLALGPLRAEKLETMEAGYYGDWRELRMVLDVRAFDERIRDFMQIVNRAVPPGSGAINAIAPAFANGPTLRMRGIEYQAKWQPTVSTQVIAAQSFVKTDFPNDGRFLSVPANTSSLAWLQRLPCRLDMAVIHSYVGAMSWNGTGGALPSHHRTDLRLAYPFRIGSARAEAAIVVQNVGGNYQEYLARLEFERRTFATLRTAF